jgi:ubiquinone/menaquinone biosynthesis C-methylase UbiE
MTSNVQTQKGYKGLPMEGVIASWYARITRKDLPRHQLMAKQLAQKIPAGGLVLEIAPGPGYFCQELAKLGDYQITGLDISHTFVDIARQNAAEAGLQIDFRLGDAAHMPFEPDSFDFTFCQAAFKNFSQPVNAIAEMYRVLRPQGQAVIVDLRRDASQAEIERYVRAMGMGRLNQWFTNWTFKHMLLKRAYSVSEMQAFVAQTPFGTCRIETDEIGFQVWLAKDQQN